MEFLPVKFCFWVPASVDSMADRDSGKSVDPESECLLAIGYPVKAKIVQKFPIKSKRNFRTTNKSSGGFEIEKSKFTF